MVAGHWWGKTPGPLTLDYITGFSNLYPVLNAECR